MHQHRYYRIGNKGIGFAWHAQRRFWPDFVRGYLGLAAVFGAVYNARVMPLRKNSLRLNPLQLKTLTIFQHLARFPESGTPNEETGEVMISNLPTPHGNHFHCGDAVVMSRDATGLRNQGVWRALERKGLARSMFPVCIFLTPEGQRYETGLADKILHRSDH